MSSFRYHRLPVLTSIGFALFASLVGAPVQARTPYDGLWSVSLKAGQGSCSEREIEVSIGAFGMWASADGQLSDGQGSGVWQFAERGCSGQWVARRSS